MKLNPYNIIIPIVIENDYSLYIRIVTFLLTQLWAHGTGLLPSTEEKRSGKCTWPFSAVIWVIKPRYHHSLFLNGLVVLDDYTQLPGFSFQFDSSPQIDGVQSLNTGAVSSYQTLTTEAESGLPLSWAFPGGRHTGEAGFKPHRTTCCSGLSPPLFKVRNAALKPHSCTFSKLSYFYLSFLSALTTGSLGWT